MGTGRPYDRHLYNNAGCKSRLTDYQSNGQKSDLLIVPDDPDENQNPVLGNPQVQKDTM